MTEEELEQFEQQKQPVKTVAENSKEITEEIHEETPEENHEETHEETSEKVVGEKPEETPIKLFDKTYEETSETITFDEDSNDGEGATKLSKWLWIAFGALCLIILSGLGGYHWGRQQMTVVPDTIIVRDTVYLPHSQDSVGMEAPAPIAEKAPVKVEEPEVEMPKAEEPKVEKPKSEPAPEVDKYAAKDERVRLGAYRIVGLDHEVTVLQGQTFYSICRAHLGPDMECYIEVYNDLPRNPNIKAGQVIKIPKLQLKKRKKQ